METMSELKAQVKRLRDELNKAEGALNSAALAQLRDKHGIAVGVEYSMQGVIWKIERIEDAASSMPSFYGRRKTKAGWHATVQWMGFAGSVLRKTQEDA